MKNRNCFLWEVFKTLFKFKGRVIFSFKKNLERVYLIMNRRSSLENYTSNSTRQQNTTRVQHETTQHNMSATRSNMAQQETTRHKTSKTRDNTSEIRRNTSTTRLSTSTKEARVAKIGLYFSLFVTELCIFSIQSRFKLWLLGLHIFFSFFKN